MTGGLQWMMLHFVFPLCYLPHLHVHLENKQYLLHLRVFKNIEMT